MALFSSQPTPEIRQAPELSLEARRALRVLPLAIGMLESSVNTLEENTIDHSNTNSDTYREEIVDSAAEPGSVTALQEYYRNKVAIAHEVRGLYHHPAESMSDDYTRAMQDIQTSPKKPTTTIQDDGTSAFAVNNEANATVIPLMQRFKSANPGTQSGDSSGINQEEAA